ncbi:hypothetical protein, partial [Raoultella ornithinolytica]|uniref:hypothetical protein n=1 Tax=Raoultella ornithinolytica TaxID=54291 RepID=UPI0019535202
SNPVHFRYSRFSKVLSVKWRAFIGNRVARTTPKWVCPTAGSNHEIVPTHGLIGVLKSEIGGCSEYFLSQYQYLILLPFAGH